MEGILSLKGVIEVIDEDEREDDRKAAEAAVLAGFADTLKRLAEMRVREGDALARVLGLRLDEISALAGRAENAPGRKALSKQMMGYWAQFARTGAPGRGSDGTQTEWQAWSAGPSGGQYMVLDTDAGGGTRMSSETKTADSVLAAVDADPR